jgi:hypothetical protein
MTSLLGGGLEAQEMRKSMKMKQVKNKINFFKFILLLFKKNPA